MQGILSRFPNSYQPSDCRWQRWGFPGGSAVKNPPANAGHAGSIPDPGRFHVPGAAQPGHPNYWACALGGRSYRAHVPQLLKPERPRVCAPQQEKLLQWEAHAPQPESTHHSLQLEKSTAAVGTQHSSNKKSRKQLNKAVSSILLDSQRKTGPCWILRIGKSYIKYC